MEIKDVKYLATLARMEVSQEEQEALLHDLTAILEYIDQVTTAKVSEHRDAAPAHHNVVREDVVTTITGTYTELMLGQAVDEQDGFVKVKKIM